MEILIYHLAVLLTRRRFQRCTGSDAGECWLAHFVGAREPLAPAVVEGMRIETKEAFRSGEQAYSSDGEEFANPQILVVGCGDAGCKMVTRLANLEVDGAETLAVNTDRRMMERIRADRKMLIGRGFVEGDGAGGDPKIGRIAAGRSRRALEDALGNRDLVFVAAGLGGGTGTGAAPVICEMAKGLGSTVVGIFTIPPGADLRRGEGGDGEGGDGEGGDGGGGDGGVEPDRPIEIEELAKTANTLILLDNSRILEMAPGLSADQVFSVMDQVVAEIIRGIVETITETSLINLDFADVKTIMSSGGLSAVLVGESDSKDEAEEIVSSALKFPMLDVDTKAATGCLLHITGGSDLTLKKAATIAAALTGELDPEANVIWGARVKEGHEGKIGLLAIMTGVGFPQVVGGRS
ncbi:MAG TPA: cell division protein FtsZ [Methanothrix sp.]|nr:cell division protein FtsZ [Methanothrix sp.]